MSSDGDPITKNTRMHVHSDAKCAVKGCPVITGLVGVGSSYLGLRIDIPICQKHLGGKR